MRDLTLAMRSVEINSPGRSKYSGGHKIIHRLFSFHLADYGEDRLSRDRFRQVPFSRRRGPFGWPASVVYHGENERFRNYYAVDATKEIPFTIGTFTIRTHTYIYIFYALTPWFVHADGMRPHACARIRACLSRDVSHGGFAWYPSSTSNLFVCIGMSLCRLIHARRPCRVRHVGCSAAPTRGYECICIFYWRHCTYGFPIAQTRATHDAIPSPFVNLC